MGRLRVPSAAELPSASCIWNPHTCIAWSTPNALSTQDSEQASCMMTSAWAHAGGITLGARLILHIDCNIVRELQDFVHNKEQQLLADQQAAEQF